jgi:hypothetical protein
MRLRPPRRTASANIGLVRKRRRMRHGTKHKQADRPPDVGRREGGYFPKHRRDGQRSWSPSRRGHTREKSRPISAGLESILWAKGDLNPHVPKDTGT